MIVFMLLSGGSLAVSDTIDHSNDETLNSWLWTYSDAKKAAEALAADCLNATWLAEFTAQTGDKPLVITGLIRNWSSSYTDTATLKQYLEESLVDSGKVRVKFIESSEVREDIRDAMERTPGRYQKSILLEIGTKTGADFIFYGGFTHTIKGSEDK